MECGCCVGRRGSGRLPSTGRASCICLCLWLPWVPVGCLLFRLKHHQLLALNDSFFTSVTRIVTLDYSFLPGLIQEPYNLQLMIL